MALDPLATLSDLGARLGLDLTGDARATALLADVSAKVRGHTGRTFTLIEDDEAVVGVCGGVATLPNGPVTAVSTVTVDGTEVTFTWTTGRRVYDIDGIAATVTYSHGYAEVPDEIVAVVCQIAGRAYGVLPTDAGADESLGDYSIGASPAAAAGPLGMMNDERATLDRYKAAPAQPIEMGTWVPARW